MQAILFCELKGFSKLSTDLSLKMEEVALSSARVRAGTVEIIKNAINSLRPHFSLNQDFYIGGDTFVFTFNTIEEAISFGCSFSHKLLNLVLERGLYYIKPCMCVGYENIKLQGERFYDDTSIETYRIADGSPPFTLWLNGQPVISAAEKLGIYKLEKTPDKPLAKLDWQSVSDTVGSSIQTPEIIIPSLLLDSEILFSNTAEEAVKKLKQYQNEAKSIYAFGGPVPFDIAYYNDYLRDTLRIIKEDKSCKWTIISYLDINDKKSSYYWLELARRISVKYNDRYTFTAYTVPDGVLIPYSYQIFDDNIIHLGLRSYSPQRNSATMNASIIFKNNKVALRYREEFIESYRKLRTFTDEKFGDLLKHFSSLDKTAKKECIDLVDELLK